jgi:hypothetical protein
MFVNEAVSDVWILRSRNPTSEIFQFLLRVHLRILLFSRNTRSLISSRITGSKANHLQSSPLAVRWWSIPISSRSVIFHLFGRFRALRESVLIFGWKLRRSALEPMIGDGYCMTLRPDRRDIRLVEYEDGLETRIGIIWSEIFQKFTVWFVLSKLRLQKFHPNFVWPCTTG